MVCVVVGVEMVWTRRGELKALCCCVLPTLLVAQVVSYNPQPGVCVKFRYRNFLTPNPVSPALQQSPAQVPWCDACTYQSGASLGTFEGGLVGWAMYPVAGRVHAQLPLPPCLSSPGTLQSYRYFIFPWGVGRPSRYPQSLSG